MGEEFTCVRSVKRVTVRRAAEWWERLEGMSKRVRERAGISLTSSPSCPSYTSIIALSAAGLYFEGVDLNLRFGISPHRHTSCCPQMTKPKPDRERHHRGEASQSPDETMSPNRSDRRRRVAPPFGLLSGHERHVEERPGVWKGRGSTVQSVR